MISEQFHLFTPLFADKTIKLWKISERDKRPEGYNLKEEDGRYKDPNTITSLRVSTLIKHNLGVLDLKLGSELPCPNRCDQTSQAPSLHD